MLPTLDLAAAESDPDAFRSQLRQAAHRHGFFYLIGHNVPADQIAEVLSLTRQFFALPAEAKDEISQLKSPQFRGYSRLGGELTNGEVDWRKQIDIGPERGVIADAAGYWRLQGPNLWPTALPALRPAFERWSAALSAVGLRPYRERACPRPPRRVSSGVCARSRGGGARNLLQSQRLIGAFHETRLC